MTLSAENLFFSYDKRSSVLEDISFSIQPGQFVGVFGPNGGGKTTLLKLLLGLLKPDKGKVALLGESPNRVSEKTGYVPQVRQFDKQFPISVLEVVLQGCLATHRGYGGFSREAKKRALSALETVGLEEKANVAFGTLSGGQMQRILIARALSSNPEILFLDEATVGVDPKTLTEIFRFLISLKGKITILMVTHDLQAIANEMDVLFCINKDISFYTPKEVCQHFTMGLYHPRISKEKQ